MTRVDGVGYTFDNNGNLLVTGLLTNTFDAANRLIETTRAGTTLQPRYDGLGNRVGQTVGLSTTTFALDGQGLPEVISTGVGKAYLHLPGVIVAEDAAGERRFLLPMAWRVYARRLMRPGQLWSIMSSTRMAIPFLILHS